MRDKLANELMDASAGRGGAFKKKDDTHRWRRRTRPSLTTAGRRSAPGGPGPAPRRRVGGVPRRRGAQVLCIVARTDPSRTGSAISASWRTSMPGRRRRPSGSCSTPGSTTRWERFTTARRPWTGWPRSRSAGSPSPPPPRPVSGATTASTSSTRRGTWISRPRSSDRCACSTVPSLCSARSAASSRSPRRSGARPTSTACRASRS